MTVRHGFAGLALGVGFIICASAPAQALATFAIDVEQVRICPGGTLDRTCWATDVDQGLVQDIYAQIDVQVNFTRVRTIHDFDIDAFADPAGGYRASSLLDAFRLAYADAFGAPDGHAVLGYTPTLANGVLGLAYIGGPYGIMTAESSYSQRVLAGVFAHDLGHILRANHAFEQDDDDLMWPTTNVADYDTPGWLPSINEEDMLAMRSSSLLYEVPDLPPEQPEDPPLSAVPLAPSLPLLAAGLGALGLWRRRGAGERVVA